MNRRHLATGIAAIGVLTAACGSDAPTISSGAGNTLRADVLALTQAAAAHQWSTADQALAQLRGDLTAAVAADGLSVDRAQAIRADVATIAADLAAHRTAQTPQTSSASSTRPKAPKPPKQPKQPKPKPPGHGGHGDHGPGHGGHGGGEH
jgi:hypothetical protein